MTVWQIPVMAEVYAQNSKKSLKYAKILTTTEIPPMAALNQKTQDT